MSQSALIRSSEGLPTWFIAMSIIRRLLTLSPRLRFCALRRRGSRPCGSSTSLIALRPMPEVRNAEGDELLFCAVHYPFADGAAADDIRLALNRCPELRQENATFWNWIGPRRSAKTLSAQKRSLKFQTFLDDSALVFGSVELKDKGLILSVNSQARSERGRALLSEVLDGLVVQPLVEVQTLEQCMATRDPAPP